MKARKHTLLIVDDDPDQRFLSKTTFEALATNYRIQLAASGAEAIDYLEGKGKFAQRSQFEFPSYILTDLNMHPGDGFHILEYLKKNPALSVIPVVMLSDSAHPDDIRQAYLLGASSYFAKPTTLRALKVLLHKIHDYWTECQVPEVDAEGYAIPTNSAGRPGARYSKPKP